MVLRNALGKLDEETKRNIAKALWMPSFSAETLPTDALNRLVNHENSNEGFGDRMRYRLRNLLNHRDSPLFFTYASFRACRHSDRTIQQFDQPEEVIQDGIGRGIRTPHDPKGRRVSASGASPWVNRASLYLRNH